MAGSGDDRVTGIAAALADVVTGPLSAPAEAGEQANLWGEGVGAGPLDTPADLLGQMGRDLWGKPRRGGGRPAGAKNRSTEAWRAYFLASHRDPLLAAADIYSMPVEELAMRLRCDPLDAMKLQLRAAEVVAPYVHQKLPLAIKAEGNLPTLHLHMPYVPAAAGPVADGAEVLDLFATEMQQNQGVAPLSAQVDGTAQLVRDKEDEQHQWLTTDGAQTSNPPVGARRDMIAHDASHNPPPDRDTGGDPPADGPPVLPLSVQQVHKV